MRNKCLDLKVHNMRHAFCKDQVLIFAAIQGPSLREAAFEHHCTPWGNGAGAEKEGSRSDRMKVVVLAWMPELTISHQMHSERTFGLLWDEHTIYGNMYIHINIFFYYLSIYPSIYLSIYLFIYLSIYLSIYICVYIYISN